MRWPGQGKSSSNDTSEGALAKAGSPRRGLGASALENVMQRILDAGIDGRARFQSAAVVADRARAAAPDREAAIDRVVRAHQRLGAAGGAVTSAGGFVTLPVALPANVAAFYLVATRMVAAIAALRGYDVRQEQIRAAVLLTIVGADSDDLLRKAGLAAPAGGMTRFVAERLPGPAVMVVNKALGFRVVHQVLRRGLARAGRMVPVIGAAVGAGLDTYLLTRIADQARKEFPPTAA